MEVLEAGLDAVQDAAVDSVRPLESLSVRVHQAFHPEGTLPFTQGPLTAPSSHSEQPSDAPDPVHPGILGLYDVKPLPQLSV